MAFLFCYTKPGIGTWPEDRYPGHTAYNCDWEQAMHLAFSEDGKHFIPLRNDTGILFPLASFDEGDPKGVTKTMADPWLFRSREGGFLVCAIRRNRNRRDSVLPGCIQLFSSEDGVRYREAGFLRVTPEDREVREPAACWDGERKAYRVTWREDGGYFMGYTEDFSSLAGRQPCENPLARIRETGERKGDGLLLLSPAGQEMILDQSGDKPGQQREIQPGNVLEVSDGELRRIRLYLDEIHHVGNDPLRLRLKAGEKPELSRLPKVTCRYSDGSVHEKAAIWDAEALAAADWRRPGTWRIPGKLIPRGYAFPISLNFGAYEASEINDPNMYRGMSDPCVTLYRGKYYLSSSGNQQITLRCADRIEDVFGAEPHVVYRVPVEEMGLRMCGTWAAELHEIGGALCMLTTICPDGDWTKVQAVVLRCSGDPLDQGAWEAPRYCVLPDGSLISRRGISLDMTYFEDAGRHFIMWSNRLIYEENGEQVIEPAEIDIAEIDPARPWQLVSGAVCVARPDYGWDRYETEVDEGPYLLRRGDDLWITISGSSTGMADLYDVGLLRAKTGADLLNPASWEKWPYPLLTKESAAGQLGPGHNNFVTDRETGDTVMVYHAVPPAEAGEKGDWRTTRQPAIRRLHWAASGLPYLEMTPERDLDPALREVTLELTFE
ncbi:MAG: family 43 glycosylhydrolase [Clostridia bacterium]|nr:family 43 glycosylhydrolase [Clostridia bacterium]